ncbi:uncharacterized protein LOC117113242 [Anneissia japonica]|uniref:uncharacterized protein LOC117113242 n=1 Tax=Anneissia japonica TaxID=1529436 RepID=UPI001425A6F4|nr:uncharacterized protein LOC117113242 [Anneissia japonica]XP_033112425.1 uncharacterized protein LOC117113242 [Anneissia japonica]XP_033112426.1 uncharacterized protein LOC117113242 [Anneissia japonica]XP_033112427.1 uncharacterized protein LOC117113242 [Anneissia japonica]XP_033112428.1 uncharacterized protein LOC117113242 [Anneissia japonica]
MDHDMLADEIERRYIDEPWQVGPSNTWDKSIKQTSHRLVEVSKNDEYKHIQKLFNKTLPEGNIIKLERVENYNCRAAYGRRKEIMIKTNCFDERQLFHGTEEENVDDICRENFDFRLSGKRIGAKYGNGAYFARNAKYANDYAEADDHNIKKMFVARVMVGRYTRGTQGIRRPPYKDPENKSRGMYDSCVDNTSDPNIFVLFDNHQVYPEYLITYSTASVNQTSYSNSNQQSSPNTYSRQSLNANQTSHSRSNQQQSPNKINPLPSRQSKRSVVGVYQTSYYSNSNQQSSPNTYSRQSLSANQTSHNRSNQQPSPNQINPLPSRQSKRSVVGANQTAYSSSNQQSFPNTYSRQSLSANQTSHSRSNQQQSPNQINPLPSRQSKRSVVGANQTAYSSSNQQSSNQINSLPDWLRQLYQSSVQSIRSVVGAIQTAYSNSNQQSANPASNVNQQSPNTYNTWPSIQSIKSALDNINNDNFTELEIFSLFLLFMTSVSLLLTYTPSYVFFIYLLFCFVSIVRPPNVIYWMNVWWRCVYRKEICLIVILSLLLLLSLVSQLFTDWVPILSSVCYNNFDMYILFSLFISAKMYVNEMEIDVKSVCQFVLLSELFIVLLLPVILLFLYLLEVLILFCYNHFVILYLMISTVIFVNIYANKNMDVKYKYKCGLISQLFILFMLLILPLFLYIIQKLLLCRYNMLVMYVGLLFFIFIYASIYEYKMNIKDGHVCKWVIISELLILSLFPVLQLIIYISQILVYIFLILFILVSIIIPTLILNLL